MAKADQAALAVFGGVIGAAAVTYLVCRLRDEWYLQQGQPDRCVLPAIQAGLQAGIDRLFGPIPLPVQAGIDYVLRSPDLYEPYGGAYFLRLSSESFGGESLWE